MKKDLNFRFFYYRTRAAYEFDKANKNMPDGAIIFIEEDSTIITHDHEFGPSTHVTISPEEKDNIINDITALLSGNFDSVNSSIINLTNYIDNNTTQLGELQQNVIEFVNNINTDLDETKRNINTKIDLTLNAAKSYTDLEIQNIRPYVVTSTDDLGFQINTLIIS